MTSDPSQSEGYSRKTLCLCVSRKYISLTKWVWIHFFHCVTTLLRLTLVRINSGCPPHVESVRKQKSRSASNVSLT